MDRESLLERGKYGGFAIVATVGWMYLSVFTVLVVGIVYSVLWFLENVTREVLRFYGKDLEFSLLAVLCGVGRFLLINFLNIARIRPSEGTDIEEGELTPLVLYRVVCWDMAKPNRVTFTLGFLLTALWLVNWF